jgi:phosphatidylinositol kinase/protein kinase (PI-3  family)
LKEERKLQLIEEEDNLLFSPATHPSPRRGSNDAFYDERPKENTIFPEISREQDERVRKNSPFGSLKTWRLLKIIVKSNDDVRQEQFAMQLIAQMDQIFKLKKLDLWLKPYEILATGQRCGLIEVVQDAMSIDSIKRKLSTPN